jgi:group I intron endonuclease
MKTYIIYLATSPSGKVYVGATSDSLKTRKQSHISLARGNKRRIFQMALKKYHFDFKWEILEEGLAREEAELVEKYYIAFFDSTDRRFGYNLSPGGLAGDVRSPEGEARRKAKMAEHYKNPEFIKKLSELRRNEFKNGKIIWNKGKTTAPEVVEKLRSSHLGNKSRLGHKIQFCPNGHDTFIVGREKSGGGCKQCRRKRPMRQSV